MLETLYRTVTPELEVRAKGGRYDGRTVTGIAIPYGVPQRIDARLTEQFARGAFGSPEELARHANKVKFARGHVALGGTLIGLATLLRDDTAGLYVELRVSKTPTGDETLELIKDGALRELSIGFREQPNGNARLPGGIIERRKVDLFEVASVLEGAFGELAVATGVRSAGGAAGSVPPGEVRVYVDGEEVDASKFEHLIRTVRLEEAKQYVAELPDLPPEPEPVAS